jgi:hypothetical protein
MACETLKDQSLPFKVIRTGWLEEICPTSRMGQLQNITSFHIIPLQIQTIINL